MGKSKNVESSKPRPRVRFARAECLRLAEKVLKETESTLTAQEIWRTAHSKGYVKAIMPDVKDAEIASLTAWLSLSYHLSRASKKNSTLFRRETGVPLRYGLPHTKPGGLEGLWKDTHFRTKRAEKLGTKRLAKLIRKAKSPQPRFKITTKNEPVRSPYVRAYVRLRAEYCCELCSEQGFEADDGSLYIEVHHLILLADGGNDTPDNAVALCATCHRKLHFSKDRNALLKELKRKVVFFP